MIHKTFALAFIFVLALGSDLTDQNEKYYDAVSEPNQEGMWSKINDSACNVKDQDEKYYDAVSESKQGGMWNKIKYAAYKDQKQGGTIELEKHLKTQKLLSESQKPKSSPAFAFIRSKDLQREISTNLTPRTLMKAKMVDKNWIGIDEIYNKLTPRAGLFENKETKEIIFETKENSLNEIQLAQKIKFEDSTNDSQNLIQERNWNDLFSKQIITSTRHGRDFQKALIELVDVDTREAVSRRTPLYLAVMWERIDLMELFLKRGADVDTIDNKRETPLFRAVLCGKKFGTIDFLLTHGANPNFSVVGKTIMYHLAERNDTPLIELFLKHAAYINEPHYSGTPQIFAACIEYKIQINAATVELLLARGADPNLKDALGKTMLHYAAARKNNVTLIEILLKHGANIDARDSIFGRSPLMYAAQWGNCEAVEFLLRRRANPKIVDRIGKNAYDFCTEYENRHTCISTCACNLIRAESNQSQFISGFC